MYMYIYSTPLQAIAEAGGQATGQGLGTRRAVHLVRYVYVYVYT